jgi:aerobic carbon-monoxide dehydrogenase small subunit
VTERIRVRLYVNGERHDLDLEPRRTLADVLRDDCGLTGTHLGCEHGVCGACTVLLDEEPVRACLVLGVQAAGATVRTVEGLAPSPDEHHPLQEAFWAHHGLQCGFCTPGFLMLAVSALEANADATDAQLTDVLSSNLCRCTGYAAIVDSVRCARETMAGRVCPLPEAHA